ncbi:MAG: alpha/beta hydrolase [Actinomycetota bacterium]|nr:alpha/beta hydrolase [Actinomycetota bacterium]
MKDLELVAGSLSRDGEEIYWELVRDAEEGNADRRPVVVLSHGAGGSHAVWYQQIPQIGEKYRVVTWDSRGFGNSTNNTAQLAPENAARDLAAVLDELEISEAHLVGQSMGGWHISAFLTLFNERVRSLTYADTVGGLWTDDLRRAYEEFRADGGLQGTREFPLVGGHLALWTGATDRDVAHAFLYQALGSFHSPPLDRLGEVLEFTIHHSDFDDLNIPVLFIGGEYDQIFPASMLRDSANRIRGAQFAQIPDAGHSPYFEQPAAWNLALLEFLAAVN